MPASQGLPFWSGAGISHCSHEEATLVQHCSVSFGTEHSYYTGKVERRAQGNARGRLEMDVEHRHSLVSGLQCCFQQVGLQHLWRQPRTEVRWTKTPARHPSEQPDMPHCSSGKKSTASYQLLPQTCKSIWRLSPTSGADLQHQPGPSILCPAPPHPNMPLPKSSEGEPKGQLCHLLHAAITAETKELSTGSSTIHTCQLCQP